MRACVATRLLARAAVPLVPVALKDLAMTSRDDEIIPLDPPLPDADEQRVVAPLTCPSFSSQ